MSQASETDIQSPSDACEQSPLQIDEKFCQTIIKTISKHSSAALTGASLSRGVLADSEISADSNAVAVNAPKTPINNL